MMRLVSRRVARYAAAAFAFLALGTVASCGGDATSSAGPARLSVLLTDAPGDVKAAVVTISEIDLQGSHGSTVLTNTPVTTNLLTLAGTTASLVSKGVVPPGTYAQLRFVITGGYVEVDNGDGTSSIFASSPDYAGLPSGAHVAGTLKMPSFGQSGLKVNLPASDATLTNGEKIVLVDFDVSQSFGHAAGNSGQWVMHPVVTATDFEVTGGLTVDVTLDPSVTMPTVNGSVLTLADFDAVLTASDNSTHQVALADAGNGTFEATFPFLAPGDYSLDFTAPSGVTFTMNPTVPATEHVASGETTKAAFTVTAVQVKP
ncbi:MAG TPA: DUF4382 domain-containing protein [Gemmatimonadaceae bacterium]|nr:DUF4382 domain-containing protein [Gemmatimonadaceae bacterium]